MKLLALAALAACGDNRLLPPDAAIDAPPGVPDLALVAAQMDQSMLVTDDTFEPASCEVVEGCIDAPGSRRLLRFNVVTANLGTADLDLGPTPPPGVSEGIFVWSQCHMHHHVLGYASFTLRDSDDQIVVAGHKQAFCLEDDVQVVPGGPSHGFRCNNQGITVGWAAPRSRSTTPTWRR